MTNIETKLISINAALAERAERLRGFYAGSHMPAAERLIAAGIQDQIRDLETEKHALLQELPL
jgi:hypothetical protein